MEVATVSNEDSRALFDIPPHNLDSHLQHVKLQVENTPTSPKVMHNQLANERSYISEISLLFGIPFFAALDVTAHELTHGVTYYTSNLIYKSDSGAMNEAMSDVFGATVERVKGGKGSQYVWIMGEDVTLSGAGVRNMVSYRADFPVADTARSLEVSTPGKPSTVRSLRLVSDPLPRER
jgi:Thermolysin metallopeptidase, alpha-helical domain